ncbi:MAG: 50S ribosomal protein L20 [Candidatus Aerophobetes bacterium]|nr:50S ribosomal protein L20 [Candidatus Aerophobetes bacterium]
MSRVKRGIIHTKKRKKVLRQTKGYRAGRSKLYVLAKEAVKKALFRSYIDRKRRKRDLRRLWIVRINAAARQQGLSYSLFTKGLKKSNINLNRKVLSDLAINNPSEFSQLVGVAKRALKE